MGMPMPAGGQKIEDAEGLPPVPSDAPPGSWVSRGPDGKPMLNVYDAKYPDGTAAPMPSMPPRPVMPAMPPQPVMSAMPPQPVRPPQPVMPAMMPQPVMPAMPISRPGSAAPMGESLAHARPVCA